MTTAAPTAGTRPTGWRPGEPLSTALLVAAAVLATLAMDAGSLMATLRGGFADPDDAMRLAEVRAWLAGQSWYDMTMMRLDPPLGASMHWSRLVDLPMAAAISLFGLVAAPATAERAAAVAVPTLWLALLYLGVVRLAVRLVGPVARLPAALGLLVCGATLVEFAPGRIGHHAPETVALVWAVHVAVGALDPHRARDGFVCGLLVALALAMSLETLPFLGVLVGGYAAIWAWRGADLRGGLAHLATGLMVALPALFAIQVPPGGWGAPVCDAFGGAHLLAGFVGAAGLLVLSRAGLSSLAARAAGLSLAGAAALAVVALAVPNCLHSPFAGVDPLVRDLWLSHVVESLPLQRFLQQRAMLALAIVLPIAFGVAGLVWAALRAESIAAGRFALVALVAGSGLALSLWQVRVLGSVGPLALCGGVALVAGWRAALHHRGRAGAACGALAILPFGSTFWLVALPADPPEARTAAIARCLAPEALAPLAALPAGSIVAPINVGSHLVADTRLSPFAAPYHRNDDGNRFAFEVFLADPAAARAMLAARKVAYVATCPGMPEMARLAARAPDGLAAALARGAVPEGLRPLALAGTPYRVFTVDKGGG